MNTSKSAFESIAADFESSDGAVRHAHIIDEDLLTVADWNDLVADIADDDNDDLDIADERRLLLMNEVYSETNSQLYDWTGFTDRNVVYSLPEGCDEVRAW